MEATSKRAIEPESYGSQSWIEQELAASKLPDARLDKRLRHLMELLACEIPALAPHDLRRTCARLCHQAGGELLIRPLNTDKWVPHPSRVLCGMDGIA